MNDNEKKVATILAEWQRLAKASTLNANKVSPGGKSVLTTHEMCSLTVGDNLFTDNELVKEICSQGAEFLRRYNVRVAKFCSHEVKNDWTTALAITISNENNLPHIGQTLKDNKEFIIEAIKWVDVWEFLSDKLKDDDDIVNITLKNNPKAIEYTPERFQKDKALVLELFKLDRFLIQHIHTDLKDDAEFLFECWKVIEKDFPQSNNLLNYITREFIENMNDELKPYFTTIDKDMDNGTLAKQMRACFHKYLLTKEINQKLLPEQDPQSKRPKI